MIWENIQLSFTSLLSNKMRALLTMLGIIIGIMSIITIVIIGDAMSASVTDELAGLGADNITVSVQERGRTSSGMGGMGMGGGGARQTAALTGRTPLSEDLLSDTMVADMLAFFPEDIQGVSITHALGNAEVRDMDRTANISISGVNPDYTFANSVELISGRWITTEDLEANAMTAVVSDRLVSQMFPQGTHPIGQQVRVFMPSSIEIYTIVGVYRHVENAFMGMMMAADEIPTNFYIPLTTARHGLLERNYTNMTVIGAPDTDINVLTSALQMYFDMVYISNEFWQVHVSNMTSMLDMITSTLDTISIAIAFIAGISLLVGGIGVMNIMLVSVTERTREIGTRKALGAKNFHIRFQFVMESLIVASIGGIIGMVLGIFLGGAIASIFGAPMVLSPVVLIGSMLFSMAIGVFFGLYPANKAAKLDPIEALRYE
ncbi:MAG: ABC transporter permease [Defluviitaleaceae bacterium]|nr:ABC transporter permease [Defluviitaleaceae bacterium]